MAQFTEEFVVAVTWWPFELHPETPPEGRNVEELLARSGRAGQGYREHLKAYAAEAGLTLASNRWVANSHRALELTEFARDRGAFEPVHEALFRAYFVEGQNIGEVEVLKHICSANGLDAEEFGVEMLLGRYADLVDRTTALAREKGVTSTPAIIFDDRAVITGAQDLLVYQDLLRRLGAKPRERGA